MYTEDYKREDFPYRSFLIKFIIIIIVVALLVCIVTAISKNKKNITENKSSEEVFSNNLEKMKNSAIKYYNENNIPRDIGKSDKLTLKKMISLKLISQLKDGNKESCNYEKSYIKLVKKENEYQLKVNLVCNKEKDYIIVHLNNNSYCNNTYLCEIKSENISNEKQIETKEDEEPQNTNNNNNTSNNSVPKTTQKKPISKKNITTTTTTKRIRKTQIIPISNKGTITIVDTTSLYLYEYAKNNNISYSSWSLWSNWETTDCNTKKIDCSNSNSICTSELKLYNRKEKVNIYKKYTTTKKTLKNSGNDNLEICTNNNFIKINNIIYKLDSSDDYKLINTINKNTKSNVGGWVYNGRENYNTPPTDEYNTHYILVDADYSNCGNTCSTLPKYTYDKYTYTKPLTVVSSYTCNTNKKSIVPVYTLYTENVIVGRNEEVYGTVCYKSIRTRNIINNGLTTKKWSTYNNKTLLDDGYYYTGNKKKI